MKAFITEYEHDFHCFLNNLEDKKIAIYPKTTGKVTLITPISLLKEDESRMRHQDKDIILTKV